MPKIDWDLVIKITVPLLTLILGKYLDRWLLARPRLISYVGHVSSFTLRNEQRSLVFTHAIVIRNVGREAANHVRIGHHELPVNYQILPSVPHKVEQPSTGGAEILIDKMVPGEQITISYLYAPPLTWDRVNSYTKSDEGFADILNAIPTPQPPKWVINFLWGLILIGAISSLYFVVYLVAVVMKWRF